MFLQLHSLVTCLIEAHRSVYLQVDILSNDDEVQEVVQFVSDNAKRVLNVDTARVIPVSSRLALDAKLAVGDEATGESFLWCSTYVTEVVIEPLLTALSSYRSASVPLVVLTYLSIPTLLTTERGQSSCLLCRGFTDIKQRPTAAGQAVGCQPLRQS